VIGASDHARTIHVGVRKRGEILGLPLVGGTDLGRVELKRLFSLPLRLHGDLDLGEAVAAN
jgi:hypothetical protein